MNKLYSDEGSLRCYYAYPKGLMGLGLRDTDKSVYLLLLDRARLSARSGDRWRDSQGRVFLFYPVMDLAADLGCSKAAVCNSLNALEGKDLIFRQRQGMGKPNRIYVKLPPEVGKAGLQGVCDPGLHGSQTPGLPDPTLLDPNKKERNKTSDGKGRARTSFSYGIKTNPPAGPTQEDYARMQRLLARMEARAASMPSQEDQG